MTTPSVSNTLVCTHLVVGDGLTALAFVESCPLVAGETLIILGENAGQLGRGAAYPLGVDRPWRYAYLLNSPSDDIDPDFAQWVLDSWDDIRTKMTGRKPDWLAAAQPLVDAGDIFGLNVPREIFGDFIHQQAEQALANLKAKGVDVQIIEDRALTLDQTEEGVTIRTEQGLTITAASVDVAPGGPSTLRIDGDDGPFSVPTVFGQEDRIAEHITAGAEIFCVGGNAAMLDVLRLCQSLVAEDDLRFVACAPDGEVPAALIPRLPRKLTSPNLSRGHASADSLLAEIRREIDAALAAGDEMREIRAGFRAHFLENPLSQYLTDSTEAGRVPATLRFWLRGGTRDTIQDMNRLVNSGQARVVTGFAMAIEHTDTGAIVHVKDAEGVETAHETGFVINCAGAGPNSRYDALTEDMLAKGLIETCEISKGLKTGPKCSCGAPNIRHLSPATTVIGDEVMAMPLYDAHMLRTQVKRATS